MWKQLLMSIKGLGAFYEKNKTNVIYSKKTLNTFNYYSIIINKVAKNYFQRRKYHFLIVSLAFLLLQPIK